MPLFFKQLKNKIIKLKSNRQNVRSDLRSFSLHAIKRQQYFACLDGHQEVCKNQLLWLVSVYCFLMLLLPIKMELICNLLDANRESDIDQFWGLILLLLS